MHAEVRVATRPGLVLAGERCREVRFQVTVEREVVAPVLPSPFRAADRAPGQALVLVSLRRFQSLASEGLEGPATVADVSVVVDPPAGMHGRHFYHLSRTTDSEPLADLLWAAGVRASFEPRIAIAEDGERLDADVGGALHLAATVRPYPAATDRTSTGWHLHDGQVRRLRREVDVRTQAVGEGTLLAAPGGEVARLVGERATGRVVASQCDLVETIDAVT